jgi:hypothetical protein
MLTVVAISDGAKDMPAGCFTWSPAIVTKRGSDGNTIIEVKDATSFDTYRCFFYNGEWSEWKNMNAFSGEWVLFSSVNPSDYKGQWLFQLHATTGSGHQFQEARNIFEFPMTFDSSATYVKYQFSPTFEDLHGDQYRVYVCDDVVNIYKKAAGSTSWTATTSGVELYAKKISN